MSKNRIQIFIFFSALNWICKASDCLSERLPFTTLGGRNPDEAAYNHTSSLSTFTNGFTMCFHYRYMIEFTILNTYSRYHLLDFDQRIIIFAEYNTSQFSHYTSVQINLDEVTHTVSFPLFPFLWTNICIMQDTEKGLVTVLYRQGMQSIPIYSEFDTNEREVLIPTGLLQIGNSSMFNAEIDYSFPAAISNMLISNFTMADNDEMSLSYIHRKAKLFVLIFFREDSLYYDNLAIREEFNVFSTRIFTKLKDREPIFKNNTLNFASDQNLVTVGEFPPLNLLEYNVAQKDPSIGFDISMIMHITKLPVGNSSRIVYFIQGEIGWKMNISPEGYLEFHSGHDQPIRNFSSVPLPFNKEEPFELRLTIARNFFLKRYEFSCFFNGNRTGKMTLGVQQLTNFGESNAAFRLSSTFGSDDPHSLLEWSFIKFVYFNGISLIGNHKCYSSQESCHSMPYIGDDGVVSCMLCSKDTEETILSLVPIETRCFELNPNDIFKTKLFRQPYSIKSVWSDCSLDQFIDIECPKCHPSCKACFDDSPEGCLACYEHELIYLDDGRCLAHESIKKYEIKRNEDNSIVVRAAQGDDDFIINQNVEFIFDGWKLNEHYSQTRLYSVIGGGRMIKFLFFKTQFNTTLTVNIYSMPKNYFQAKVIKSQRFEYKQLPQFSVANISNTQGLASTTQTLLSFDLLITIAVPYLGRVFQKLNSFAVLLIYPIALPPNTEDFLTQFINLNKEDRLGRFAYTVLPYDERKTNLKNKKANFVPIYLMRRATKLIYRIIVFALYLIFIRCYQPSEKPIQWILSFSLKKLLASLKSAIQVDVTLDVIYFTFAFAKSGTTPNKFEAYFALFDLCLIFMIHFAYLLLAKQYKKTNNIKLNLLGMKIRNIQNEENKSKHYYTTAEFWFVDNIYIFVQVIGSHVFWFYPNIFVVFLMISSLFKIIYKLNSSKRKKLNYMIDEVFCDFLRLSLNLALSLNYFGYTNFDFLTKGLLLTEFSIHIFFQITRTLASFFCQAISCWRVNNLAVESSSLQFWHDDKEGSSVVEQSSRSRGALIRPNAQHQFSSSKVRSHRRNK